MSGFDPAQLPPGPLVAWYGDDFTGAAAVMEILAFAGLPAVLFLDIPNEAQRARFADCRGIGIAGTARAHSPEWMDQHLPPVFDWLRALGAPLTHYKVCSTLDSSPSIGSIGHAIDIAAERIRGAWVPCLIASPGIRRYQCFGHLFAAAPGGVFRLDRHPVMARHPVTPMDEADVAMHLSRQTTRQMGVLDIGALADDAAARAALGALVDAGRQVICMDTVTIEHLARCGALLWERRAAAPFVVGSQGIEEALVRHWQMTGALSPAPAAPGIGRARGTIVVSGSVSLVTAGQIDWSLDHGFTGIALDVAALLRGDAAHAAELARVQNAALAAFAAGGDPLIYSARGPDDPAVAALRQAQAVSGVSAEGVNAMIGDALGHLLAQLIRRTGIRRAVISGGDTSGHASRHLGLYALTALAPTIPGASLFRAHSDDVAFDGLELALKGGQMGTPDYFGWIRSGGGAVGRPAAP